MYITEMTDMKGMYETCILKKKKMNYNNTIKIINIIKGNATYLL